jgi:hypothetical protein
MHCYREQQFENAIIIFEQILAADPGDQTAKFFMENASRFIRQGVPENWTGAEEMLSK